MARFRLGSDSLAAIIAIPPVSSSAFVPLLTAWRLHPTDRACLSCADAVPFDASVFLPFARSLPELLVVDLIQALVPL
jgi:hypothetical protein